MAKIRKIRHGHQAPYWHLLLVVVEYQAVIQSENQLPHAQCTLDLLYFYRTPYKMTISGAD